MSEAWIGALAGALVMVIVGAVPAWLAYRKGSVEISKIARGDIIEEWREITDRLQERTMMLEKEVLALRTETTRVYAELSALRTENAKLHAELSALRAQIVVRETERVQQRGEIRSLDKAVSELQKPDPQAIADALAPKIAEAIKDQSLAKEVP